MGNEKPDAPKSTKIEPMHDNGAEHEAPALTPFQADSYTAPPPAQEVAQVGGQNPPAKDAPAADGAQKDAPVPAPPVKDAPVEKKVVTDKTEAGSDKATEAIDPYEHVANAQTLREQLDTLVAQGRKSEEYIPVRVNGEVKEVKVADRVAQLKRDMVAEIELAKKGASSILMVGDGATKRGIDDIAKVNTADRDKLAKELGLDPANLNINVLGDEYTKAAGNKDRQDKIAALGEVLVTRDSLSRLHFAPMAVKMLEAEFLGRGYLDPKLKIEDQVSEVHLKQAADKFAEAAKPGNAADIAAFGNGKEISDAKEVYGTTARTLDILKLDQQQKLGLSILAETDLASKPGEDPETHFKNAIKLAETQKVGYLALAAHDPINKEIAQEIVDTIRMGSNARLKYAEHLVTKGRFNEAQGLMAQVKADSPELIYAMENDQPIYRKYDNGKGGKRSYEELDRAVTLGISVKPATFEQAHSLLFDKLGKDKLGTQADADNFGKRLERGELAKDADKINYLRSDDAKSTECLKVMKASRDQAKQDVTKANEVVDKELQVQEAAKKKFEGRDNLTKDEEIEKARVERVIASLQNTKAEREAYINRIDALTDFTEGVVHLSLGGAKSAHELFEAALKKDPSLDAEFAKMKVDNPDVKTLTELSKMTDNTLDAYWQRNYKKFAVAGAAIAGTLTGVGLIGVCGYVGAGVTTTAVVATTGGALAGGATSWGIHRTVNEKAGWPEFRDGAKVGGLSAALVASPWAAQAYRAKLGTDVAANTSQIGNLASKIGITKGTLVGSMAMSYSFAAGDVYFDKKPIGKATVDATKEGIYNSLLLGISQKWGMPMEGSSAVAKAASMFNKTTLGYGFGLAALPQAMAMAFDGKPMKEAVSETLRDGTQNTIMFGLMSKMKVTEAGKETMLGRYGINKWTVPGIVGVSGYNPVKNYFDGKQTFQDAAKDWLTNAAIDTVAVGAVKRYGLNDHGTGSRIAAPTMKDTLVYGQRAFMMQESWNFAVAVGSKQFLHDIGGKPYYIKDQGGGFVAPLLDDFFDRNFGKGLDASHPGDRKIINQNLDGLNTPLTAGKFADKKNVDPLQKGDKQGLFFDYSKKPPKPQK